MCSGDRSVRYTVLVALNHYLRRRHGHRWLPNGSQLTFWTDLSAGHPLDGSRLGTRPGTGRCHCRTSYRRCVAGVRVSSARHIRCGRDSGIHRDAADGDPRAVAAQRVNYSSMSELSVGCSLIPGLGSSSPRTSLPWLRGHLDIEKDGLIESLGEALGVVRNELLDQIKALAITNRVRKSSIRKRITRLHYGGTRLRAAGGGRVRPSLFARYEILHAFRSARGPRCTGYARP